MDRMRTPFATLVEEDSEGVQLRPMEEEQLRQHVQRIVEAQEAMRENAAEGVAAARRNSRYHSSRGEFPRFTVGEYVLMARVTKQGRHHKLVSAWTGPWRVVNDDRDHLYFVRNILTGETRDVHVARMRFYSDENLRVTRTFG